MQCRDGAIVASKGYNWTETLYCTGFKQCCSIGHLRSYGNHSAGIYSGLMTWEARDIEMRVQVMESNEEEVDYMKAFVQSNCVR